MAVSRAHILSLAPKPKGKREMIKSRGNTRDIIEAVKKEHEKSWQEASAFCHLLKGRNRKQTFINIWNFLRKHISYQIDPIPYQFTPSPSALLHMAQGDCKGFTLFAVSVLRCLKIPYKLRFIIEPRGTTFTHVYAVGTLENGKDYPIDPIPEITGPGLESKYKQRLDIMAEIYSLSGIGKTKSDILEGELELELQLETLILERQILRRKGMATHRYDKDIASLKRAAKALDQYGPNALVSVEGISGIGKFLRKVGRKIKDGVKAAGKALSIPQKAFFNLLARVSLPKAAPFFLYNFAKQVSSLPASARRKRAKSIKLASWIMRSTGMKESTFLRITRNGIMKHMGNSPEALISAAQKGHSMAGIGAIPAAAIPIIGKIIENIVKLFKVGKEDKILKSDAPDLTKDFSVQTNTKPSHPATQIEPYAGQSSGSSMTPMLLIGAYLLATSGQKKGRRR